MPKARPVSLYPLDFDTALRALLKVPKEEIDATIARDKGQRKKAQTERMKRPGHRVSK
jgi:hypothetical protein